MKKVLMTALLLVTFVLAGATVFAQTNVEVTGEVRARTEGMDKTFVKDAKMFTETWLRSRVGIKATTESNTTAYVQFQDSRMMGSAGSASGTTTAGNNVDLHQGWIQIDRLFWDGFGMKAGRFEFVMGNERVFGAVGWSNVGRSWDGVQYWYAADQFTLTGFALKGMERRGVNEAGDITLYGLNYHCNKLGMDVFLFYEHDADTAGNFESKDELGRINIGTYYARTHGSMDYILNFVYQTGKAADNTAEWDIAAMMVAFEAMYNFDSDNKPSLGIGVDYMSGSKASDTKIKTYEGMYLTGHKFQGYIDLATTMHQMAGLMDIYLRGSVSPWEDWTLGLDIHMFQTAVDYTSALPSAEESKDVGTEFDLTVKTTSIAGASLVGGVSYFTPKDNWIGITDSDPAMWTYLMLTAGF